ncbi:MAG: helix-turn-helix domain-containing protein [Balneolaceae bacterium]
MSRRQGYRETAVKLIAILKRTRPWLNPNHRLADLCIDLELTKMQVHYLFKQKLDTNYKTLINRYRVEEAKRRLQNPSRSFQLKTVMEESGFGSLSQFNVQFKRYTGMTPSEYETFYHRFRKLTGHAPDELHKDDLSPLPFSLDSLYSVHK